LRNILVLGASYGSLFATKCLLAGHNVTLVCRETTAALIKNAGTIVRLGARGRAAPNLIRSGDLPGHLGAVTPEQSDPSGYDFAVLAMQEPQYAAAPVRALLARIAAARVPCLSLMNIPPPPYLRRFAAIDPDAADDAYNDPRAWDPFDPALVTLCSPDPQAFRPADEPVNVLQVGLATNFKAAAFPAASAAGNAILSELARDIDEARHFGEDVPVKLRIHQSPFVPLAKWPMLLTGNYRCMRQGAPVSIREAVHADPRLARDVYDSVCRIVLRLGGVPEDLVPFEKYAAAALHLEKPSSGARAIAGGAVAIERVDRLVQAIGRRHGITHPAIDASVATIDALLASNRRRAA
jgi:hypothetical protein